MVTWNSQACSDFSISEKCSGALIFSQTISFLPFVMIIGGVLVGYNLKRISDSLEPESDKGSGESVS